MKQLIARLRELEEAAAPGPWSVLEHTESTAYVVTNAKRGNFLTLAEYARLIVEANNALPQLLDRLEKLEAVVDAVGSTMPYGILSDEVYDALDALTEEK